MIKYLMCLLIFFPIITFAQSNQPLPKHEQLIELKKIDEYYKSQKKPTPSEVTNGIIRLEKELNISAKPKTPIIEQPKTKKVCKKVKTKSGKYITQCKTIKIRKKYKGKPVPTYAK